MAQHLKQEKIDTWIDILGIMDTLREQCPWDRKQTIHSLNPLSIEEAYELSEALRNEDWKSIQEELGDLLLHLVFYAKIAEEEGRFDISDVLLSLAEKLKYRHPHIYGSEKVSGEEEVKSNWERLKRKANQEGYTLDGVPTALPSVIKALRMQEKAAALGFDWPTADRVLDKINEEILEIKNAENLEEEQEEFGDLLFTLINYARKRGIDPEEALQQANAKFKKRFTLLEKELKNKAQDINDKSLDELEKIWQDVKKI